MCYDHLSMNKYSRCCDPIDPENPPAPHILASGTRTPAARATASLELDHSSPSTALPENFRKSRRENWREALIRRHQ